MSTCVFLPKRGTAKGSADVHPTSMQLVGGPSLVMLPRRMQLAGTRCLEGILCIAERRCRYLERPVSLSSWVAMCKPGRHLLRRSRYRMLLKGGSVAMTGHELRHSSSLAGVKSRLDSPLARNCYPPRCTSSPRSPLPIALRVGLAPEAP